MICYYSWHFAAVSLTPIDDLSGPSVSGPSPSVIFGVNTVTVGTKKTKVFLLENFSYFSIDRVANGLYNEVNLKWPVPIL